VLSPNDLFDLSANAEMRALDRLVRSTLKSTTRSRTASRSVPSAAISSASRNIAPTLTAPAPESTPFRDSVDETIWSQEVNLVSPDAGPLTGCSALISRPTNTTSLQAVLYRLAARSPFSEYNLQGTNPTQAEAVFGQIGYEFLPGPSARNWMEWSDMPMAARHPRAQLPFQ